MLLPLLLPLEIAQNSRAVLLGRESVAGIDMLDCTVTCSLHAAAVADIVPALSALPFLLGSALSPVVPGTHLRSSCRLTHASMRCPTSLGDQYRRNSRQNSRPMRMRAPWRKSLRYVLTCGPPGRSAHNDAVLASP